MKERLGRGTKTHLEQSRIYNSQIPAIREHWIKSIVSGLEGLKDSELQLFNKAFYTELANLEGTSDLPKIEEKEY